MRKKIARGSILAVAMLSLLAGGNSYTSEIEKKEEAPISITQAVENSVTSAAVDTKVESSEIKETVDEGKDVADDNLVEKESTKKATKKNTKKKKKKTEQSVEVMAVADAPVLGTTAEGEAIEQKEVELDSNQIVANIESYLNIRSEASEESEVIGKFYSGNVGTVVEKGEQWSVVASGNAYGYVKNEYLLFGDAAKEYIKMNCDQVAKVTAETLNIRKEQSTESDIIDLKGEGESLQILDQENGWFKVAVNDQVGYVSSQFVYVDYAYGEAVTIEEENAALAAAEAEIAAQEAMQAQQVAPQVTTQTPTTQAPTTQAPKSEKPIKQEVSTKKPESTGSLGQDIANYAVQFVGNPYVYGGTSLTNGADCSGFVQSVYRKFGYSLSRVASSQANDGRTVSINNIQPGDLVFYHGFGHVAIYIGGGQVVHASNARSGIKISSYNYSPINRVVRIIK